MSAQPVRVDRLSGWQLPPESALRAGQVRPVRVFDSPDAAIAFIKQHGSRNKRSRARRNRGAAIVQIEVSPAVVDALHRAKYLPPDVADWPAAAGAAIELVLEDWRRFWAEPPDNWAAYHR